MLIITYENNGKTSGIPFTEGITGFIYSILLINHINHRVLILTTFLPLFSLYRQTNRQTDIIKILPGD